MNQSINSKFQMVEISNEELININGGGIMDRLFDAAGYAIGSFISSWAIKMDVSGFTNAN